MTAVVVKGTDPLYVVVIVGRIAGPETALVPGTKTITAEPDDGSPLVPTKFVTAVAKEVADPA